MNQTFERIKDFKVENTFIQFEDGQLMAMPHQEDYNQFLEQFAKQSYPIYNKCKRRVTRTSTIEQDTTWDLNGYDSQTGTRRVVKAAQPLLNNNKDFIGALIWEIDLARMYSEISSYSFDEKRVPFIQFRLPEKPSD